MTDSRTLSIQKADKLSEISAKQEKIDTLEIEILHLKDTDGRKNAEVRRIEQMLVNKYAELKKQYPVDESQEQEISQFINGMGLSIRHLSNTRGQKSNIRDDLMQKFDIVDFETARFSKGGISLANLQRLIDLMELIQVKAGALPVGYRQKIDKWKDIAKNYPENLEKEEREKEAAAKKNVQNELSTAQSEIKTLKKKVSSLEFKLTSKQSELNSIKCHLTETEKQHGSSKSAIVSAHEAQKLSIQKALAEAQAKENELRAKKSRLESELSNTFMLSFGKKKKLRKQIESTIAAISVAERVIQEKRKALINEKTISSKLQETSSSEPAKLRAKEKSAEKTIASASKELESAKKLLSEEKSYASALQKALENFHVEYLLKTYGIVLENPAAQIAEKQAQHDRLTSEVFELQQDIAKIDERLRIAKCEERRLEQERLEVENRVKNELAQKENDEQIILERAQQPDGKDKYIISVDEISALANINLKQPLDDVRKKVITNSIVRLKLIQKDVSPRCERYLIYFADKFGNSISNQRILEQKSLDSTTDVSFELKSSVGFNPSDLYYLLIFDFDSGDAISALTYKINITFANDFDF